MAEEDGADSTGHILRGRTDSASVGSGETDKRHGPTHADKYNDGIGDPLRRKKDLPERHKEATLINGENTNQPIGRPPKKSAHTKE